MAVYLEDHNFYIENWLHTHFWQKIKQIAVLAHDHQFLENVEDLYYLNRWEVGQILYELSSTWASRGVPRYAYWRSIIEKRRHIFNVLKKTPPIPAIGKEPDNLNEPLTVTLFGVTDKIIKLWKSS